MVVDDEESQSLPSQTVYLRALLTVGWPLWLGACLPALCLLTSLLSSVSAALGAEKGARLLTGCVVAVYPVAALASLVALAAPRWQLGAEAAVQVSFALCFVQFFSLLLQGHHGAAPGQLLDMAVGPCCCWPFCRPLLPPTPLNKSVVTRLRVLVLQLPVVQTVVYSCLLVYGDEHLQHYLQPVALLSILCAVWAVSATLRMVGSTVPRARAKFLALQAVLVLSKVQALVRRTTVVALGGHHYHLPPPFNIPLIASLSYSGLMLLEVTALSLWARTLYKEDHKEPAAPPVQVIAPATVSAKVAAFT